jgi:hypothetical protein
MGYFAVLSPKTVGTTRSYPQAPHILSRMGSRRLFIYGVSKPGVDLVRVMLKPPAAYIFSAHIFLALSSHILAGTYKVMRGQYNKSEVGNSRDPL